MYRRIMGRQPIFKLREMMKDDGKLSNYFPPSRMSEVLYIYYEDFCPPYELLDTPEGKIHMEHCSKCKEVHRFLNDNDKKEYTYVSKVYKEMKEESYDSDVQIGQIRYTNILDRSVCWDKHLFIIPVEVFVYQVKNNKCTVAPMHNYYEFYDAYDEIKLDNFHYVECWNTFTIPKDNLKYSTISILNMYSTIKQIESKSKLRHPITLTYQKWYPFKEFRDREMQRIELYKSTYPCN